MFLLILIGAFMTRKLIAVNNFWHCLISQVCAARVYRSKSFILDVIYLFNPHNHTVRCMPMVVYFENAHRNLEMKDACIQLQSSYGTDLINQKSLNRATVRGNSLICISAKMFFGFDAKIALGPPHLHCVCSSTFSIQRKQSHGVPQKHWRLHGRRYVLMEKQCMFR